MGGGAGAGLGGVGGGGDYETIAQNSPLKQKKVKNLFSEVEKQNAVWVLILRSLAPKGNLSL